MKYNKRAKQPLKLNPMKSIANFVLISLCLSFTSIGQESLSLEEVVSVALKNNYDIQLAENNVLQAKNNQSFYNSGFLPRVTANGNANYSNSNTSITNQAGQETKINGAETKSYGGSIGINYVLFNGGNRKFQYDRLKQQYQLASAQKKLQIETTLIEVYTGFFNVARNQEQRKTLEEAYAISKERLARVEAQQQYGQKTSLEVLNAKVDANTDSINLLNAIVLLENNKRNLNFLLGREVNTPFNVKNTVVLDNSLSYEKLKMNLDSNNIQLQQISINKSISDYDLKINQAGWMPNVSASASYGVNNSDNGKVGFFQTQSSTGLNAGLNLTWDLFDGGATKVRVQNARINQKIQLLNEEKLKLSLDNQLSVFWTDYTTQQTIIENEKINVTISEKNFLKSKERFNLGQITSLDFRQAQLNLIRTQLNLLNATYNAKIAEIQLKRFAGLLLK